MAKELKLLLLGIHLCMVVTTTTPITGTTQLLCLLCYLTSTKLILDFRVSRQIRPASAGGKLVTHQNDRNQVT